MAISRRRTTVVEEFDNASAPLGNTQAPPLPTDSQTLAASSLATGEFHPEFDDSQSGNDSRSNPFPSFLGGGSPKDELGQWIARHYIALISGIFAIVTLVGAGGWYTSKFDSGLSEVKNDIRDVKSRIELLFDSVVKHGVRIDYIEQNQNKATTTAKSNKR